MLLQTQTTWKPQPREAERQPFKESTAADLRHFASIFAATAPIEH